MSESIFKKAAKRFKSIFTKGTKVYVRDKDTEREEMESAEKELRRLISLPLSDYGYPEGERSYPKQIADLNKQKQTIQDLLPKVSPDARRYLEGNANFKIEHIDNSIAPLQRNVDRRAAHDRKMAEVRRIDAEKKAAEKNRPITYQGYSFEEYKRHYS